MARPASARSTFSYQLAGRHLLFDGSEEQRLQRDGYIQAIVAPDRRDQAG